MPSARPTKLNPDAPCNCGSKKRYRNCCKPKRDRDRMLLFIGVVIGGVFVAKFLFAPAPPAPPAPPGKVWSEEHGHYHDAPSAGGQPTGAANAPASGVTPGTTPLPPGNGGTAQPAGAAPPGKVWSAEHGHWHDATAGGAAGSPTANPGGPIAPSAVNQNVPQPAGPAPPGKVWSAEHGHWHDVQKP